MVVVRPDAATAYTVPSGPTVNAAPVGGADGPMFATGLVAVANPDRPSMPVAVFTCIAQTRPVAWSSTAIVPPASRTCSSAASGTP